MRYQNQVAVISGGADGLGKAIAERLASEGASLALVDHNPEMLNKTTEEFNQLGYTARSYQTDISNEENVKSSLAQIENDFGCVDVMVNSAGIVGPTKTNVTEVELEDFLKVNAVNTTGTFLMTKYTLNIMKKKNYGRILLIASIAGKEGNAGMSCYSTSKSAVIGFTKAVGKEYAETGITINALAPAVIRTALHDTMPEAHIKFLTDKIPMKRCGTLGEAGAIAAYVCSKEAGFSTAAVFDLSGGRATY
jgi:3-oxoacyl-[acyl-carrier protein] reductase